VKIPSGAGWQFASENSSATSQASIKETLPSKIHWKKYILGQIKNN
jgi:hypothetical protein